MPSSAVDIAADSGLRRRHHRQGKALRAVTAETDNQPSRSSIRGLDWFVFFLADVQTGFGPFIAVYLTTMKWTQVEIGMILSVNGFIALLGQMPGGALVDWARSERLLAGMAVAVIGVCAAAYATFPIFPVVLAAAVLHAAASCVLGPAVAAISLGLVGRPGMGPRLGRNARFASLGSGITAAAMGATGYLFSSRSVFIVTVALAVPTLIALSYIRAAEIDPDRAHGAGVVDTPKKTKITALAFNRPLLTFALIIGLFQLANAAMLPLVASAMTARSGSWAPALIGACMVIPTLVVAAISPSIGRGAHRWGRRPFLLIGIAAVVIRGVFFAFVRDPLPVIVVQVMDGLTAAIIGVLLPLTIVDVTYGTGHFNLAQGVVGTATGLGASISTLFAGYLTDRFGSEWAFLSLAAVAMLALLLIVVAMPETRPERDLQPVPT